MAIKTTKSRSHSSKPTKKNGPANAAKRRSNGDKAPKEDADILSAAAMQNVYYIAHNAANCLELRGYGWSKDKRNKTAKREKKIK
ncbi:small lysine-rich protein 1 [Vanacampus margaritifer]